MNLKRFVLIAAAAALAWVVPGAPAQAAFPGKNGKIAFSSDRETLSAPDSLGRTIFTMDPLGASVTRLTDGPTRNVNDQDPSWSPDGTRIVFAASDVSGCGCGSYLYVMNADGTGLTRIPNTGFNANDPSWSPDGTRIAFSNIANSSTQCPGDDCKLRHDIFTIEVDGSGLKQLTFGGLADIEPAWSPDGSAIAFIRSQPTDDVLSHHLLVWKMNADGTGQTRLTETATDQGAPDWSPDGRRIAFDSLRPPNFGGNKIWVMDADGGNVTQLTGAAGEPGGIDRWPAWSPDGTRIAFTSTRSDEGWRIWSMNADGTGKTQVTTRVGAGQFDLEPDWQPAPPPRREDFKNAAQFCKAEREYFGEDAFRARYGGDANAFGRCVSRAAR
jgi:Tol biopolymer transport system component